MSRGARDCPKCGSDNTRVLDTRNEGKKTIRKHGCRACGKRWRTVQEMAVWVGWGRASQTQT